MEDINKEKQFKPRAHILTLLGEELIKNPVMAIYEMVKNSYDADAKKVDVIFKDIENLDDAAIIIEDNGIGMTDDIVENVWLEPGTDFRKPYKLDNKTREIIKSPIFERVPMGEKGVGRFAVHKLASKILLITRPKLIKRDEKTNEVLDIQLANYEIQLYINWEDFSQSKYLSDIPIKWKIKKDIQNFRFKENSGTYIRLSGLKEPWTRGMARDLKGQTLSMLSPKIDVDSFKINLNFNNKWLIDFPTFDKILDEAPFKITALISKDFGIDFEYEFILKNNKEIGHRTIKNDSKYNENIRGKIRTRLRKALELKEYDKNKIEELLLDFDSKELPFGNLIIELYTFDLDPTSMRDYTTSSDLVKKVLKEHSGIKVFKNDLRIYDYGSPGNDWLGIDLERIQSKKWFSNNNIIGFIFLDAETSNCLIEKTNREGFVENSAYITFHMVIKSVLNDFAATRYSDRTKWLKFNQKSSSNLFETKISNFKAIIENSDFTNEEKKDRLLEEAKRIEEKYEDDRTTLLIPAGVGMTASVALHEIEKLVPRMEETVKSEPFKKDIITDQVEELKQYVEGIISILRKGGKKPVDIRDSINKAFGNYRTYLRNRKIDYSINIANDVSTILCDKRFLITILMNLIDNSIYWLDTVYKKDKCIYFKAFRQDSFVHIIIADNGPGFKDDITDLVRPFFSRKDDGIGIGLYLIDTIMMQYGKFNIITDNDEIYDLEIPDIYTGAIVELIFNKNQ